LCFPGIFYVSLFAWLISHQPAVLFSQNKSATSNQLAILFSQNKPVPVISHQPTEQKELSPYYGFPVLYGTERDNLYSPGCLRDRYSERLGIISLRVLLVQHQRKLKGIDYKSTKLCSADASSVHLEKCTNNH
jgi:hypothetical protein